MDRVAPRCILVTGRQKCNPLVPLGLCVHLLSRNQSQVKYNYLLATSSSWKAESNDLIYLTACAIVQSDACKGELHVLSVNIDVRPPVLPDWYLMVNANYFFVQGGVR